METNKNFATTDNGKTAAIVSYITIIGWLISYFGMYKENKTALSTYHLRQSLLLHLIFIGLNIAIVIIAVVLPISAIGYIGWALRVIYIIYMILGALSAYNSERKALPLIGERADTIFPGI